MKAHKHILSALFPSFGGVRGGLLLALFPLWGLGGYSQDTIQFSWSADSGQTLTIGLTASAGKQFVVDFGDGYNYNEWPITGTGKWQDFPHYYKDSNEYTVTITSKTTDCFITKLRTIDGNYRDSFNTLDVSRCPSLEYLLCTGTATDLDLRYNTALTYLSFPRNRLKTLLLNENIVLDYLFLHENCFKLSDLYIFFKMKNDTNNIVLGRQNLEPLKVTVVDTVDFSNQAVFDGVATSFTVERNGVPARPVHYKIEKGLMTFRYTGDYVVRMGNTAIGGSANVIAEITVIPDTNNAIVEPKQETIKIYPNPTTGQLTINNEQFTIKNIEIFNIFGQNLLSLQSLLSPEIEIDISHFTNGIYIIKINNRVIKVIKY